MKPIHYYFTGSASWFLAYGIQSVVFSWLVTIVLEEPPAKVGLAQMALLTPAMLFMLVGGSLADQWGGRRVALLGHGLASCAPLFLTIVIYLGMLSYPMVLVFAMILGVAQAFVTPARDGLLGHVADGQIQKRVVQASMIQFGTQMLGFVAAGFADLAGPIIVLGVQFTLLFIGAVCFFRLRVEHDSTGKTGNVFKQVAVSVAEGYRTVRASGFMSTVVLQNCAMGVFFMGSYIVTLPILIRETYSGTSVELSWMNASNSLGLVLTIMILMRIGEVHRQGRALLTSQVLGSLCLATAGLELGFSLLMVSIFFWGLCGGIAMTMSRTVMQEQAPPDQRARMMAFYSFSFMGSGPIGAIVSGYLVEWLGASTALMTSSFAMLAVVIVVSLKSPLWGLDTSPSR